MLVLTRKQGEQIIVAENIRITVLAVEGNRVRLGLTAPDDVSILRVELGSWRPGASDVDSLDAERLPRSAAVAHSPHD
jgi:carbon storage regulator